MHSAACAEHRDSKYSTRGDVGGDLHNALNQRSMQALGFQADFEIWKGLVVLLEAITGDMNMQPPTCATQDSQGSVLPPSRTRLLVILDLRHVQVSPGATPEELVSMKQQA